MRAAVLLLVALVLAGCTSPAEPDASAPADLSDPAPPAVPPALPAPVVLDGTGDQTMPGLSLRGPVLRVEASHEGESFRAALVSEDGVVEEVLERPGARWVPVAPGVYRVEVEADGPWRVSLEHPDEGAAPPVVAEGEDDGAPAHVRLEQGAAEFRVRHDGEGGATFRLLSPQGRTEVLLADGRGTIDENVTTIVGAGTWFVDVRAEGAWRVEVRQEREG